MEEYPISQRSYVRQLATKYHYKRLPPEVSERSRFLFSKYIKYLGLDVNGSSDIVMSLSDIPISDGYDRIVIGDYGAYIECSNTQILKDNLILKPDQHKKLMKGYRYNCKYVHYVTTDYTMKIYLQLRKVSYADYIPGKYYISPGEIYTLQRK